jgi:hypothetical protein
VPRPRLLDARAPPGARGGGGGGGGAPTPAPAAAGGPRRRTTPGGLPAYMSQTFAYGLKDVRVDSEGVRAAAELDRSGSTLKVPAAVPARVGVKPGMHMG